MKRTGIAGLRAARFSKQHGLILLVAVLLACPAVLAQNAPLPPSDLVRQNMERVAASAAQIEEVLNRNVGLMVELKRWVAKDASDHGQLINDSDLTDRAIDNRLESDVQFRSIATVLLQKFGYLLPQPNPNSPQAKEQDAVVAGRASWLAQNEKEQLTAAHREQSTSSVQQAQVCDSRFDTNCNAPRNYPPTVEPQQIGEPPRREIGSPSGNPPAPSMPERTLPTLGNAQFLEATTGRQPGSSESELAAGTADGSMLPELVGLSPAGLGTLAPSPSANNSQSQFSPLSSTIASGIPPQSRLMGAGESLPQTDEFPNYMGANSRGYEPYEAEGDRSSQPTSGFVPNRPILSQAMLRQPDPYVDVPSLYDMYLQATPQPATPERFGMEVFENGTRNAQMIPFDLPVGPDYVVGPGDSLAINLWGGVSQQLFRTVDKEGRVALPEAGPVLVAGKSLAQVQEAVQKTLRSQFRDVSADVSLSRLRTIRVYVVGDVEHPGAYDISSLSTPLNALFAAGGPTSQGSLRTLEHNRGDQTVQDVDVYDLLLRGVKTGIERLENGDTVLVPPIGKEVTVEGMVRRPAIYELRNEKSLADVLTLAGGLLPTATLRHVEVQRVIAHQKRTMLSLDVPEDADQAAITKELDSFNVQDGDKIRIFPIAPYDQNTVYLEGHVLRPGKYSYHPGMRVTDLINSYKELLPEPAAQYAEIIRLNAPDYRPTVESFDLADALSHPGSAPLLDPLDTVQIFGRYDFTNPPTVSVWGDVRVPGTYRTSGQLHLSDAIHMAGGIAADAETEDAQVFRHLPDGKSKIFSVNLAQALAGNPADNIVLDTRDGILVHRNPADVDPATVYIQGQVARPGRYPLTSNMRVADLIRAAGGVQPGAYLETADLTRYEWKGQKQIVGQEQEIELATAMRGSPSADVPLANGDVLTIKQLPGWNDLGATIEVRGEVTHPGSYGIRPGERLSSVLERAGGFQPDAYPYGAVLIRGEVQGIEDKSYTELVARVREEQSSLQLASVKASDPDEKLADNAAYQQWQTTVDNLMNNPPLGRVMIEISGNIRSWAKTSRDVAVRAGDELVIPKRPSFVMVEGQVYNPTAVAYRPGKSAKWYLSQAGGPTNLANKKAVFVIRADGTVIGSHGSYWILGSALSESLQPGDTVVVPERALGGPPAWKALFQAIQVGSAITTTAILAAKY